MSKITLFDLPTKGKQVAWSLNPWKIRLALNYKKVDYETQWVEYPDIAPTLSPHLPPNTSPSRAYTIPAARLPSGSYTMDSDSIIIALEAMHPTPTLHVDLTSPLHVEVLAALASVRSALQGVWQPRVPDILAEPSRAYFERTRAEVLGMSLAELKEREGGEEAWMQALPGIKKLDEISRRKEGSFVLGRDVSYTDFVIVGMMHFFRVVDVNIFDRVIKAGPELQKLYKACGEWLERDDH